MRLVPRWWKILVVLWLGCSGELGRTGRMGLDAADRGDSGAPRADAGVAVVDAGPLGVDAGVAMTPDAGSPAVDAGAPEPPPSCVWAWIDRGGPAYQPHACRPGPGVVDGMLVDPMAFFFDLVAGTDPDTWPVVLSKIEGELWSCGIGQQRGSGGDVRGRMFLPTAACPDASPPPGDTMATFLGVRQEPDCWAHVADVADCP